MSCPTENKLEVNCQEESWFRLEATITDEDGNPITSAMIDSLVVTIVEVNSGDIVNGRDNQNVLNSNGGTLDDMTGLFSFQVVPDDTAIVNSSTLIGNVEEHLATFSLTWNTNRKIHWTYSILIQNETSVPQGV